MLVSDISEPGNKNYDQKETPLIVKQRESLPVNLRIIRKKTQGNAVHGCISPPLIEKAACLIEMVEVFLVFLSAPEIKVGDFKIAPEMARAVSICTTRFIRAQIVVC